jgi:hypothetical protein
MAITNGLLTMPTPPPGTPITPLFIRPKRQSLTPRNTARRSEDLLERGVHRTLIEFKPGMTGPYLVSTDREQARHFSTAPKMTKYLTKEVGIDPFAVERALVKLRMKGKTQIIFVVRH